MPQLHLKRIVALLISIAIFGYLLFRASRGIDQLWDIRTHINPVWAISAVLCQLVGTLVAVSIWVGIVHQLGNQYPYWFHFQVFGVSALVRKLPGTIWYAITRLKIYEQAGASRNTIMIALSIEVASLSFAGAIGFLIGLTRGFSQNFVSKNVIYIIVLLVSIVIIGVYLLLKSRSMAKGSLVNRINQSLRQTKLTWVDILRYVICELVVIVFATGVLYFVCLALYPNSVIYFSDLFGAFSLAVALGPIAMWLPGDIGLKDGFVYVILRLTLGDSSAALATLVWRLFVTLLEITLGFFCSLSLGLAYFRSSKFQINVQPTSNKK